MKSHKGDFATVLLTYRHTFRFFLIFHLLILPVIFHQEVCCFSLTVYIKQRHILPYLYARHSIVRRTIPGKEYSSNCEFTSFVLGNIFHMVYSLLLIHLLLLQSGKVHPNPGPSSVSSDRSYISSLSSTLNSLQSLGLSCHPSFVHYNVQSIVPKLDIIMVELSEFAISSFSETWLNPAVTNDDISLLPYHLPEHKDCVADSHGGVIIHIKDHIHYVRRHDLEPIGVECIWVELTLKHKHILFGLFYRPPNSDALYFSSIVDSIHLAVDTGIQDIIVTGDYNYNMLNSQTSSKIKSICEQFSFTQTINAPSHFTEHTSSFIDIILTNNENHLLFTEVGYPFLKQEVRYHCPIFGILNFTKPNRKSYLCHTWSYDRGDYNLLGEKASTTNWERIYYEDVQNITEHIIDISKACIPNRLTQIRPDEPPWMNTSNMHYIRLR